MNRFVSLLLIPLLMLGHGLAHSHAGTGTGQLNDRAARPHIHLTSHDHHENRDHHGHSHHRHSHGSDLISDDGDHGDSVHRKADSGRGRLHLAGLNDYASNAVYLMSSTQTYSRPRDICPPEKAFVVGFNESNLVIDFQTSLRGSTIPLRLCLSQPFYILLASLRL